MLYNVSFLCFQVILLSYLVYSVLLISNDIMFTCRKHFTVLSSFITVIVTRVTQRVSHVEQEVPHPSGAPEFTTGFSGVLVMQSLVFCVVFCRSLFVLLPPLIWPLCFLSFDLRILITHLVSSNSSYIHRILYTRKLKMN